MKPFAVALFALLLASCQTPATPSTAAGGGLPLFPYGGFAGIVYGPTVDPASPTLAASYKAIPGYSIVARHDDILRARIYFRGYCGC